MRLCFLCRASNIIHFNHDDDSFIHSLLRQCCLSFYSKANGRNIELPMAWCGSKSVEHYNAPRMRFPIWNCNRRSISSNRKNGILILMHTVHDNDGIIRRKQWHSAAGASRRGMELEKTSGKNFSIAPQKLFCHTLLALLARPTFKCIKFGFWNSLEYAQYIHSRADRAVRHSLSDASPPSKSASTHRKSIWFIRHWPWHCHQSSSGSASAEIQSCDRNFVR